MTEPQSGDAEAAAAGAEVELTADDPPGGQPDLEPALTTDEDAQRDDPVVKPANS